MAEKGKQSSQRTEESKVNQEPSPLPASSLEKRAQAKACVWFQLVFKEQGPSQAGERSLLRWFWSFTGTRGTAQPRISAALVVVRLPVLFSPGCFTSFQLRQIESGSSP